MTIALFGASGAIGSILMKQFLDGGDNVYAYVRNPGKITLTNENLHIVKGELTDTGAMAIAIVPADIVVSTLGPSMRGKRSDRSCPIARGHEQILKVMKKHNKKRVITLATPSLQADSEPKSTLLYVLRKFVGPVFIPWAYYDMVELGDIIKKSDVDWTVIRILNPNVKTSGNGYAVAVGGQRFKMSVSRENVARCFFDAAKKSIFIQEMPIVFNR